jgi:hypothetical protein
MLWWAAKKVSRKVSLSVSKSTIAAENFYFIVSVSFPQKMLTWDPF